MNYDVGTYSPFDNRMGEGKAQGDFPLTTED